jgi:hypothetical protein
MMKTETASTVVDNNFILTWTITLSVRNERLITICENNQMGIFSIPVAVIILIMINVYDDIVGILL